MTEIIPVLPPLDVDAPLMRLSVNHEDNQLTFNDTPLTDVESSNLILLGLVRQRSYWNFQEKERICGSLDFRNGMPGPSFPWEETPFTADEVAKADGTVPCEACPLKDWKPDPSSPRGSRQALCREQYQVPILVPSGDPVPAPVADQAYIQYRLGIITFQKSCQKTARDYMKQFQARRQALYTKTTRITLKANLGSGYRYSVPMFAEKNMVAQSAYRGMSALLAAARDKLMMPQLPLKAKTGGMLSVSVDAEQPARYSGTFFS